ncbi:TetR/AcrR family transcriptional regulator [Actinoallomurus purpureus]|uniref:TetR/AcrR family transcriptional regulator n=1 Tax=Actinoallomurus purpureus TaxID=478114 RepID=UPI0020931875|nr:TetR/AcrR family transcriptional regulator [Actinoallomurus purpureus]MCO6010778.1 TetR/AcrR family transcriptional regulator [Actinoallomurus purpureus]
MTTVRHRRHPDRTAPTDDGAGGFRRRLLDGLAASIVEKGYRTTTIADIVRRARTSRRTFYEHFADKEACFVALLTDANTEMIRRISDAVDQRAPWNTQVRQAIEAWIACAESEPAIMLSWIRDVPSLGDAARRLQRDVLEAFVDTIQTFCDTDEWRAAGIGPLSRQLAIMLLGGLRELTATTVEDGGRMSEVTDIAVQASIALLGPRTPGGSIGGR